MSDLQRVIDTLTANKAEHEKQREQAIAQANMLSGAILQIEETLRLLQTPEPTNGNEPGKTEGQSNGT